MLDVLRFVPELRAGHPVVDGALELVLGHWESRKPLGPCHHGIGTLFLLVEHPFIRHNIFYYAYVLSHFERARVDERFAVVVGALGGSIDHEGRVVVERLHRGLKELRMCAKGLPSEAATRRYGELLANLGVGSD